MGMDGCGLSGIVILIRLVSDVPEGLGLTAGSGRGM